METMLAAISLAATTVTTAPAGPISTNTLIIVIATVFVALVFDFLNGFHDAANSIATIVSTRVLTPGQAVLWAAFFNFGAAFLFGTHVAGTIAGDLFKNIDPETGLRLINLHVVTAGLVGAIVWNIITWILGLPTSSSHALVGALAGAAVLRNGIHVLKPAGWELILLGIVLAPTLGLLLGAANMIIVARLITWASHAPQFVARHPSLGFLRTPARWLASLTTPYRVDHIFRKLQLVSAALYSLGHGGNDAQKTMGIIVMLLTAAGLQSWTVSDPHNPLNMLHMGGGAQSINIAWWIILTCNFAIAMGTCFGGWRIVKTMGSGITRLQPVGGFCAETAAATAIFGFTNIRGVPISTTHAITGAIIGVGTTRSIRSVRWIWGQRILMAWILTIPCSAFVAAVTYLVIQYFIPTIG
jgi:inorganic phosphate transporter, PiT family